MVNATMRVFLAFFKAYLWQVTWSWTAAHSPARKLSFLLHPGS